MSRQNKHPRSHHRPRGGEASSLNSFAQGVRSAKGLALEESGPNAFLDTKTSVLIIPLSLAPAPLEGPGAGQMPEDVFLVFVSITEIEVRPSNPVAAAEFLKLAEAVPIRTPLSVQRSAREAVLAYVRRIAKETGRLHA